MPFVTNGEARLYYESHGDPSRPSVTFAHGRGGNAASWWQQVPRFAEDYHVVVFDHRCFGRSSCPPEAFDRERFDADLVAILDALDVKRSAIVCQSMGGWTGLRTALHHPDRVSALVLSNTPAGVATPGAQAALAQSRREFARVGVGRAAVAPDFPSLHPQSAYLYRHIGSLNTGLPADLSAGGRGEVTREMLAGFSIPTLLVTSANDSLFAPTVIREVADWIPGAEFTELPTAGHSPYFETPDTFNETVAGFLNQHLC